MEDDDLDGLDGLDMPADDELYVLLEEEPEDGDGGPRPSLGQSLRAAGPAARAAARTSRRAATATAVRLLRPDRRALLRIGAVVVATGAAAGAAVGVTSWWDGSDARAARAGTVALKLDSVVDGPVPRTGVGGSAGSAGSPDGTNSTAGSDGTTGAPTTAEYVLEIADNGPAPVTVDDVRADARPTYSTVAWHPLGSATIPAGGTARVAVDLALDCGGLPDAESVAGGRDLFPNPQLTVTTPNGVRHTVVLATDPVGLAPTDQQDGPAEVVALLTDPCHPDSPDLTLTSHSSPSRTFPQASSSSGPLTHVRLAYDGVAVPATGPLGSFGLDFTATDLDAQPVTIDTRLFGSIPITVTDTAGRVTVAPAQPARFRVTIKLGFCDASTTDPEAVLDTPAFVVDYGSGETEAMPLAGVVADAGLGLAGDIATQVEKVCP